MGLDKAGQYFDIGLDQPLVETHGVSKRRVAERNQIGVIEGVVLETAVIIDDLIAQHLAQFGIGLRTVGAQRVEQRDVVPSDARRF
jgi:hypothetical protein